MLCKVSAQNSKQDTTSEESSQKGTVGSPGKAHGLRVISNKPYKSDYCESKQNIETDNHETNGPTIVERANGISCKMLADFSVFVSMNGAYRFIWCCCFAINVLCQFCRDYHLSLLDAETLQNVSVMSLLS